jgi:hypothetical protein
MRFVFTMLIVASLSMVGRISAQTTQPASNGRLEFRAGQAFDRGDYARALPLLRKLVEQLKERPAKASVIQERIKICEAALAKAPPIGMTPGADHRTPHPTPVPGQVLEISIKDLGNFNYDPDKGGMIPDDVKRLSGSKVRLSGYMIPIDQVDHITQFTLVPSLTACCFGQPPQVQHTILCTVSSGKAVSFSPQQIVVEGTLSVEEKKDDGYVTSIFQLESTSISDAPVVPGK